MLETRTGNRLSVESAQAANLYQKAVDLILGSESGAAETLDRALELEPAFALAAAARYCVAKDVGEPGAEAYRALAERASLGASDREREHVDVLIGIIDQPGATLARAMAYIETSPADLLVVSQIAGYLLFYGGPQKLEAVLNVFESVEGALGNDWAFLARLGFAASEAGQRTRGRELLERALEIRPQALYSIHGLAHVLWGMMGHPFVALHVAGLYASAGDLSGLKRCEDTISGKAAGVNRDVSLALVSALSHFVAGDCSRAAQTLAALSPSARIGIGGSNVERILVDLLETRCLARR